MTKHDQRAVSIEGKIVCLSCTGGDCWNCIDIERAMVFGKDIVSLCKCKHDNLEKQLP